MEEVFPENNSELVPIWFCYGYDVLIIWLWSGSDLAQTLNRLSCFYKKENQTKVVVCDLGNPMKGGTKVSDHMTDPATVWLSGAEPMCCWWIGSLRFYWWRSVRQKWEEADGGVDSQMSNSCSRFKQEVYSEDQFVTESELYVPVNVVFNEMDRVRAVTKPD